LRKKFVIKIVGDYAWEQYQNKTQCPMPNAQLDLIDAFQGKKYDWKTELRRKIQKSVCRKADKIIVPSEYLKKIVMDWGINEKKIKVIYNSFDRRGYTQIESRQVGNTQINADTSAFISVSPKADNQRVSADIIISAGRPEPWKGFDTLNEIMPDLLKENSKFKLIIETKMPHSELMAHFKTSMMFVLNTGYEGMSHLILEAMACGLPVITTNVCGNPEVVQNEYNGLLVEYNNKEQLKNAILKLWRDEELRKKFIGNGHKTLEKFTLEEMLNKTSQIIFNNHVKN
ncbi:MAG: glycosyltransferase family 4 protein, partial [Nanoarchaeota archaeon]|nr:glycosyltransferase family 4 protein [Nanoarchaeota archaeon]